FFRRRDKIKLLRLLSLAYRPCRQPFLLEGKLCPAVVHKLSKSVKKNRNEESGNRKNSQSVCNEKRSARPVLHPTIASLPKSSRPKSTAPNNTTPNNRKTCRWNVSPSQNRPPWHSR